MEKKILVLYVDDEEDLLKIGKLFLERSGDFTVITVSGAKEAINLFSNQTFDIIISDYQMPGMDGIAFLKHLKAVGDATPFILFTGRGREEVVIEALNEGADFYIQKGGEPQSQFAELAHKIRMAVSRKQAEEKARDIEKQLFDIIDFLPDATFAINNEGVVIAWNRAIEKMTGVPARDMLGKGDHAYTIPFYGVQRPLLLDLIDKDDDEIRSIYPSVQRKGHTLFIEVFTPALFGGKGAYIWATGVPLFDAHGIRIGAIESIRDITDRKLTEIELLRQNEELQAANEEISSTEEELRCNLDELTRQELTLRMSEERLLMAQEIGQTGCWEYNLETNTIWGSAEGLRIFGFPPVAGDFPIDEIEACIPERDRVHQALVDLLTDGREYNLEYLIHPADGSADRVIHSVARLEKDAQGDHLRVLGIIQDITERKQAENALYESEVLLRGLFDTMPSGAAIYSVKNDGSRGSDYIIADFNRVSLLIEGKRKEEVVGRSLADLRPNIDEFGLIPIFQKVWKTGETVFYPAKIYVDDAYTNWYENYVFRLPTGQIVAIYNDVTETKRAEEALQQSEERLRLTLDAANDGIWDWNVPAGSAIFSPRWFTMLGYEPDELPSTYATWRSLIHPDDLQATEQKITDHIQKKDEGYTVEFRMQTKNGNWTWILARGKVIERDAAGDPVRMVGTHTDISDRKRAEDDRESLIIDLGANNEELHAAYEELTATEEELRHQYDTIAKAEADLRQTTGYLENLISIANVPIIVWDPSFQIIRLNHAFELLIGRFAEEVIGSPLELLFPPDQRERSIRLLKTTQEGVRWETVEIDIMHQNGSLRTLLWNSATLYTPDGMTPVATIAQGDDITDERRLEQEKEQALTQITKNLAQLAILNDGIRNPLAVITLSTNQIGDSSVTHQIIGQIQRIDEMINQLDQRWLESETILGYLQKHYLISYDSPDEQTRSEEEERSQPGTREERELPGRKGPILIEEVQAQLYTILDSIDALVYVTDMNTHELLYMNRQGRSAFGDVLGKKCYAVIHQNLTGPCTFCTSHLLTDEAGLTGVYQWEFQNPRTGRWYDCRDRAIRWTDGRLVRLEIATDITDLKQGEAELREKEAALLEDHKIARMGRWSLDIRTSNLHWSEGIFELFEINPAQFKATYEAFMDLVHPDDRDRVNQAYTDSLTNKKPYEIAHRLLMKDGRVKWVNEICHTDYDKDGNPLHSVGVVQEITTLKEAEEALRESKGRIRKTLDAILSPDGDIGDLKLADIIDVPEIQLLFNDFYSLTRIGVAIVDSAGNILASTGWQDICSKFHRVNPETCAHCRESDTILTQGITPGTSRLYRCKNNMWDFSTPIVVGEVHLGNLFIGQFLFDDEELDYSLFREQAKRYGFDEKAYIAALDRVLRCDRETVNTVMDLYSRFIHQVIQLSWSNIKLARTVTERDTLLTSVQGSEEKFRSYLNNAPNGVFIADEEGRYIEVNPAACTITGYSEEELVQMRTFDLIPPESFEDAAKHFQRVVETGKANGELPFRHKDGSLRYWSVDAVQISPTRFMGFVQDTTGRRQMEESLRESETKYRQVVEFANEAIVVAQEGVLVLVNPKTAELTGYPEEDLWHMPFFSFIHPDDRAMVVDRYQRRMQGEEPPSRYSFRLLKKDGITAWVEISAVPIEWEGRPASLNFLIDITDRRQAEEALRGSNQKLRLLTGLTRHDIFNQVSAVQLLLDMALDSSNLPKIHEYISCARQAGDQIEKTIGFTREYEGFGTSSSGWQRIYQMIESAKGEVAPGNVTVENQVRKDIEVYADPIIRKVFSTLMENAIRHGGKIRNIRFFGSDREDTLIITCEDDGVGVPSEEKEHIFDHGYGKHTGIGLFLAREILSITGLSIRETGVFGEGARFEIQVPAAKWRQVK